MNFTQVHCLPAVSRIQFKIATLTHKILSTGTPSYLSSLLYHYQLTRQLRLFSSNLLVQPPSKTKFGFLAFHTATPSDLEWPASRCQVITFLSDFQENAQNLLFSQPSHLGHMPVLRLRSVSVGPTWTQSLRPWRVFQIVIIIIILCALYDFVRGAAPQNIGFISKFLWGQKMSGNIQKLYQNHHHHRLNVHFLPRLIKGLDSCFPTALGRQSTFSKIMIW